MTAGTATRRMFEHLRGIADRVGECAGDVQAIRAVIDDFSCLDEATRRVEGRAVPCPDPRGEWVTAPGSDPDRRLLYLHGGSWLSGSPYGYRPMAARISRSTGCSVFVLDYRLAPENPFPAGLDDCARACRWLRRNGPEAARAATFVAVAGDSAGGNLTLATVLRLKDEGDEAPDATVALSPAVDLTWKSPSIRTRADVDPILRPDRLTLISQVYVQGAQSLEHPYVSPVFGDFAGLRNILIQAGDQEVLLDDARRIADRLTEQGVRAELQIYPGMPHVFQMFAPTVGTAGEAIENMGRFIRSSMTRLP
jgi:acetyl esterase/lipase